MRKAVNCMIGGAGTLVLFLATSAWGQDGGGDGSSADPVISARALVDSGFAWRASRLLDPILARPGRRSPQVERLAAQAAAGWNGWARVLRLLQDRPWLAADSTGEGYALLARAALEEGADSLALRAARLALQREHPARGERLLLLARALERAGEGDSAAAAYIEAQAVLPALGDWLLLRAAAALSDSVRRERLYEVISDPTAKNRVDLTEAAARYRQEEYAAAADRYRRLGHRAKAIEAELRGPVTPSRRTVARQALFDLLSPNGDPSQAREAIETLDREFPTHTPEEELVIARRAEEIGLLDRAATGYRRAGEPLSGPDQYRYGALLVRLGREAQAIAVLAMVRDSVYRGRAMYQRARAILRAGAAGRAMLALEDVIRDFPRDIDAASSAIYLRADLHTDRGDDSLAREGFLRVGQEYPTSRFADQARFRAALLGLVVGKPLLAAREWDALVRDRPDGEERDAALWWSGRGYAAAGDSSTAWERWRRLAAERSGGYYVALAATQVGTDPWRMPTGGGADSDSTADRHLARAGALERMGLLPEARLERDAAVRQAGSSAEALLAVAVSFSRAGDPGQAMRLADRARARGAPETDAMLRLLFPLPYRELLTREATRFELDPHLVSALIRQESAFDPQAQSSADARGLMQVLPALGSMMARREGIPDWDPVMLYQPEVNLAFGIAHLEEALSRYGGVERALAAYNAGKHRVERWSEKAGTSDPQVFVERIPFVETRSYIRRIARNLVIYRSLYSPPADQP